MSKPNPYFPCEIVEQDSDYSIVCSNFHYFNDYFGNREVGGYTIERLAKKLVREHAIEGVKFDSEAGMFCAFSDRKGPLKRLCTKLRAITGGEKKHVAPRVNSEPSVSLAKAERLLLKGFVISLDKRAQSKFLQHVPCPALSKQQDECLQAIQKGTEPEKIKALRKIRSEAATRVRDWENFLSHPATTQALLDSCDENQDSPAVYQLLISAMVFICMRHLPDLRAKPYFLAALEAEQQLLRSDGIYGLYHLCVLTPEILEPLLADKSSKVRDAAETCLRWIENSKMKYPSWMFDSENPGQPSITTS